jgi:lysyl-tRNA synthetase class I
VRFFRARATLDGSNSLVISRSVGKRFSEIPRSPSEIEAYADAMNDMFCAYLESLGHEEKELNARQS